MNRFLPACWSSVAAAFGIVCLPMASESVLAASAPVVSTPGSPLAAFYSNGMATLTISADGHVQELLSTGAWHAIDMSIGSNAVGAAPGSPLSLMNGVSYLSADGHVQNVLSATVSNDLTFAAGGVPAAAGSGLSSIRLQQSGQSGHEQIYYIDADGHVEELADGNNGGWTVTDLTAVSGGIPAAAGSALTSFDLLMRWPNSSSPLEDHPRLYYFSADGHVQELAYDDGWQASDITVRSGGVAAVPGSALTSYPLPASGRPRVYYFDASGHVQELAWVGNGWQPSDITARTGAAAAVAGSALTSMVLNANSMRIYYLSYEGHVRELAWTGSWSASDIAAKTSAAPAVAGSALSSILGPNGQSAVFYITPDSHIHELLWSGSAWSTTDANAGR